MEKFSPVFSGDNIPDQVSGVHSMNECTVYTTYLIQDLNATETGVSKIPVMQACMTGIFDTAFDVNFNVSFVL